MKKLMLLALLAGALISCDSGNVEKTSNQADEQDKAAFLPPLMGWSSWNTYHVNINEELIKRQADAMVSQGLKDVGYLYINTDDGFFGWRDETGLMHAHPDRFPNGMKPVADHIHSLGLKAGIYSDAGTNTCGSMGDNDERGIGSGLYGHEQQDMDLYLKEWGFDFIKIDYCGGSELGLDEHQRYAEIVDAIHKTGRDDVSINICRWAYPGAWAAELARSWRMSGDIQDDWSFVKNIIGESLYLSAFAHDGHYNDMDMLEIGRSLTPSEEEVHFGIWCIMSSPLLIGCDMTNIRESSLNLLKNKELIAINQDKLGLQAYVAQRFGDCYAFVKDIETLHGNKRAMALYNPTEQPFEFKLDWKTMELAGDVKVRDLVHKKDLGSFDGSFIYTVEPHGVLVASIEGQRLEADTYEAEWAYLPFYNEIGTRRQMINFLPEPAASGGMMVTNIGGQPGNDIVWKNVYSEQGGNYEMTIYCNSKYKRNEKTRDLHVLVNDAEQAVVNNLHSDDIEAIKVNVILQPGFNKVAMNNTIFWAPDIDRFTLKKM